MKIIETLYSNVKHTNNGLSLFGVVTLITTNGPLHIECSLPYASKETFENPYPALRTDEMRQLSRLPMYQEHDDMFEQTVSVHHELMARLA